MLHIRIDVIELTLCVKSTNENLVLSEIFVMGLDERVATLFEAVTNQPIIKVYFVE